MFIINVDDDIDDSEIFCEAINAVDPEISCTHFDSGPAALDFLTNGGVLPDFIFLDINMPKMNGYECAQLIKANSDLKDIQIVMFSTAFNPRVQVEFSKQGILFLSKTGKLSNLIESLKDLISSIESIPLKEK